MVHFERLLEFTLECHDAQLDIMLDIKNWVK